MSLLGAGAAALLGLVLGVGYFGGLWWTLAALSRWRRPGVALLLSFALRGAIVVAAFGLLTRAGLPALALAFAGFLAARFALVAWLRPGGSAPRGAAHDVGDDRAGGDAGGRDRRTGAP